ncbi:hypothetical protein TRIP_C10071 [Candidatus Zixiibacteriota bacterium]|nr:hypothetical protein TRIP_C10071 [candidate division Zixibacteria bacterium]
MPKSRAFQIIIVLMSLLLIGIGGVIVIPNPASGEDIIGVVMPPVQLQMSEADSTSTIDTVKTENPEIVSSDTSTILTEIALLIIEWL